MVLYALLMEIYPEGHPVAGQWDYFAEQLMMYILGAGSPTSKVGPDILQYGQIVGRYKGNIY